MLIFILIMILLFGVIVLFREAIFYMRRTEEEIDKTQKLFEFYEVLVRWLEVKHENRLLSEYFVENHYDTVAVYGMKEIGILLYNELKAEGIRVVCALDRNADGIDAEIPILKPNKDMPKADVIVVTALHYFDKIYVDLKKITDSDVVSIQDVLWGI